jgi:hypothetical protein
MSGTITPIVAEAGGRVAEAPVRAEARPAAAPAKARQAAPANNPGWVPVVTPGTTAVVIALVSEHGVIATVPAQTSPETRAAAEHQHEVDVRT